jgi:outer membrane protein assembly factor BamA
VTVEGNNYTAAYVITREFPWSAGQVFNVNRVRKGIGNIYGTGLFDYVNVEIKNRGDHVGLVIKVVENKFTTAKVGFRYDLEESAQMFLTVGTENLFGRASKANVRLQYGPERSLGRAQFRSDRLFKSYFSTETSVLYQYRRFNYFDRAGQLWPQLQLHRWGGTALIGSQIRRFGNTSLGLKYMRLIIQRPPGPTDDEIRGIVLRSIVDTIDKFPFPNKGEYHLFTFEAAQAKSTGDQMYIKAFLSLEAYYGTWSWLTIHPKVCLGAGDLNVPFTEKFFVGGSSGRENAVPLVGFRSNELWGRNLINFNIDFRADLFRNIYGIVRYQAAYVNDNVDFINKSVVFDWGLFRQSFQNNFYSGVGAGVSLVTPLGPAELFYGYGDGAGDHRGRLNLSVGYDF